MILHKNGNMKFLDLFGRLKSVVIGMIHVKALPGKQRLLLWSVPSTAHMGSIHLLYLGNALQRKNTLHYNSPDPSVYCTVLYASNLSYNIILYANALML